MFTQNEIDDLNIEEYTEELLSQMVELGVATEEEIQLVSGINGYTATTMDDILYFKTGLRGLGQLLEEFGLLVEE